MARWLWYTILLTTLCWCALSVPTEPDSASTNPLFHKSPSSNRPSFVSRPFARLRDAIIETIWGPPPRSCHKQPHPHPPLDPAAPPNFRSRYGGDVVLRFKIQTEDEIKALAEAADILYLDVWESTDEWVDIRIQKDVLPSFLGLLPSSLRRSHTPLMHDLAQTIYETFPFTGVAQHHSTSSYVSSLHRPAGQPDAGREIFFQEYQPLSVIGPWLRLMESLFPTHVQLIQIGLSNEGREIAALRVGVQPTQSETARKRRPTILISGGSHAREWISISTVNYMAYSVITRYAKFPLVTKLLEEFDIVFIPTLNPDGYEYTWDHDRLWRKNRQETPLRFCPGVDLDRAFDFEWDGASTRDNPCSESYAGSEPFSGVEAKVLANWARNETQQNNVNFIAFLDMHSYSQQILYPYSYSCSDLPPSLEDLEEVAIGLAKGFRLSTGHIYGVSSACEGSMTSAKSNGKAVQPKMELGGGSALDWFYHEMKVKYAYQIKLRDTGSYGFLLPKGHIVPSGQEAFNALLSLGRYLLGNKGVELLDDQADWENDFILPAHRERVEKEDDEPASETDEIDENTVEDDQKQYHFELTRRRKR